MLFKKGKKEKRKNGKKTNIKLNINGKQRKGKKGNEEIHFLYYRLPFPLSFSIKFIKISNPFIFHQTFKQLKYESERSERRGQMRMKNKEENKSA